MEYVKLFLKVAFGQDWKASLIGMGAGAVAGAVAYSSGHTEPGFYVLALGLAALGRYITSPKAKAK